MYSIFSYPVQSASSTILPIRQSVQYIQLPWSICQQYNFTHQVECTVYSATLVNLPAVQFQPLGRVYSIFSYTGQSTISTILRIRQSVQYIQLPWSICQQYNFTTLGRMYSIFTYPGQSASSTILPPQLECTVYSATVVNLPAAQFYPLGRVYSIFSYPGQSTSSTILPIGQSVPYIQLPWSICQQYNFTTLGRVYSIFSYRGQSASSTILPHQVECTVYSATLVNLPAVQFYPLDRMYSIFSYRGQSASSTILLHQVECTVYSATLVNLPAVQFYHIRQNVQYIQLPWSICQQYNFTTLGRMYSIFSYSGQSTSSTILPHQVECTVYSATLVNLPAVQFYHIRQNVQYIQLPWSICQQYNFTHCVECTVYSATLVNLQAVQFYPLGRVYSIFSYPGQSASSTILPVRQSVQYIQLPWSICQQYNLTHQVECTVYSATVVNLPAV